MPEQDGKPFPLNLSLFIARRLTAPGTGAFSGLIIRLCIATSALSVLVMILAVALITGFKREITSKVFDFWGHVVLTDMEINQSFLPVPLKRDAVAADVLAGLRESDIAPFRNGAGAKSDRPVVRHIQSFVLFPGILKNKNDFEGIQVKGIGTDLLPSFFDQYMSRGRPPAIAGDSISREIVLSEQTAARLQVDTGEVVDIYFIREGDQIIRRFTVSGLYKTGLEEYDRKVAFADMRILQQILGWSQEQVSGMEIFLNDLDNSNPFVQYLFDEILPMEVYAIPISARFPAIFEWLQLQDYNQYLIIGLMIVVCIFNLVTTALILILERVHMIGLLKTLGMPTRRIRMIFVWFALRILIYAILIGNAAGLLLCWLQKTFHIVRLNEADYYLSEAPIHLDPVFVLTLNLGLILIVFLVLLLPVLLVQRISPIRAIRLD